MKILGSWSELFTRVDSVIALSSLRGRVPRGLPPPITFEEISPSLRAGRHIALVFGPERGGLTTEELRQCDARLRIATSPDFPTLNVAQAVVATLALLSPFEERRRRRGSVLTEDSPATAKEMRRLLDSFKETLSSAGYPGRGRSKEVLAELESFLRRGGPTTREVTILLGAFAALRRRRR